MDLWAKPNRAEAVVDFDALGTGGGGQVKSVNGSVQVGSVIDW